MRVLVALLLMALFGYGATITVAAAANMSYVLPELVKSFEKKHPGIKIQAVFASSGKLAAQIQKGAPFEIFLSADMDYPKKLYRQGYTATRPLVYAKGELVFLSEKITSLKDLPKLSRIAIANPKTAPYGKAAKEALQNMGLWQKVRSKLIFGESVAQTFFYATKAADGGFVARSALYAPKAKAVQKHIIPVDRAFYRPIEQGAVLLKRASGEAKEFFCFLFSPEAVKILESFGYRCDD